MSIQSFDFQQILIGTGDQNKSENATLELSEKENLDHENNCCRTEEDKPVTHSHFCKLFCCVLPGTRRNAFKIDMKPKNFGKFQAKSLLPDSSCFEYHFTSPGYILSTVTMLAQL